MNDTRAQSQDTKDGIASSNGQHHHDDPMPSTSDFVKKLYKCVPPELSYPLSLILP